MTNEQIEKLLNKNAELLFILGYASSAILALSSNLPEEKRNGVLWIIQAIENVVYQDKPMPPLPAVVF